MSRRLARRRLRPSLGILGQGIEGVGNKDCSATSSVMLRPGSSSSSSSSLWMSSLGSIGTRDTVTRRVTVVTSSVSRIRLRERDLVTRELQDGSVGSREPAPEEEDAGGSGSRSAAFVLPALEDVLVAGVRAPLIA